MTQHTEQEIKPCKFANGACIHCEATEREECEGWVCPPKRPWVGLTDDEHCDIWYKESLDWMEYGKAIEAKLKEKNFD